MPENAFAHLTSPDVMARARKIKLFLMDVDGTLTGGVCLISSTAADGSGNSAVSEMKVFNAHDGQGLSLATPWEFRQASSPVDILLPLPSAPRN